MATHDYTCSVETCTKRHESRGYCKTHYGRWRVNGNPLRPCLTCGEDMAVSKGKTYCSEECQPECRIEGCWRNVTTDNDVCQLHRKTIRNTGREPGTVWAKERKCLVCGAEGWQENGRRTYCSDSCQQIGYRYRKAGADRPKTAECVLCGSEFSLARRDGRYPRTDTIWCRDCGRDSPEAQRYKFYGVTPERYNAAVDAGCEICGTLTEKLHVDHDHDCCPTTTRRNTCGECVRGFLCGNCNRALGLLRDDLESLERAVAYLTR